MVRHEQGAVHAAEGYARATGKVGVALVTSGPGATNAVTGIADAYMDSIPLVVITGQVPTAVIGTDAFQEVDTFGITLPIVKHSYLVKDVRDLEWVIDEAFEIASSGKPGPVVIDIPKDVSGLVCEKGNERRDELVFAEPEQYVDRAKIAKVVDKLLAAKQPVFYVGGGIVTSDASDELMKVAQTLQVPVTLTLMGLGGFPTAHLLSLGMLGMHGTYTANTAIQQCDLLFAIGVRFDDRVTGKLATFALIDVSAKAGAERQEIMNLVAIFRAKVVDISHEKMILEMSGTREKVDTFIEMLKPLEVNDVTRSGCVAISRLSPFERMAELAETAKV